MICNDHDHDDVVVDGDVQSSSNFRRLFYSPEMIWEFALRLMVGRFQSL